MLAVVGNGNENFEVKLAQTTATGNIYSNLFDTTKLPSYALFPTISSGHGTSWGMSPPSAMSSRSTTRRPPSIWILPTCVE